MSDAKTLMQRIETAYAFECEAGPLSNCQEWKSLKEAIRLAEVSFDKILFEFEMARKPAGYICTIFAQTGRNALSQIAEPLHPDTESA